jgi:hypothetical protein
MKRKFFGIASVCVGLTLFSLIGCKTTEIKSEGSLVIRIGDELPPPEPGNVQIEDGSYVCSSAQFLRGQSLSEMIFGGKRVIYKGNKYIPTGDKKSVAIRINKGKVTEIMAVKQGKGETASTYATATEYYSVEGLVWVPSGADLDKASNFNEAKAMIH